MIIKERIKKLVSTLSPLLVDFIEKSDEKKGKIIPNSPFMGKWTGYSDVLNSITTDVDFPKRWKLAFEVTSVEPEPKMFGGNFSISGTGTLDSLDSKMAYSFDLEFIGLNKRNTVTVFYMSKPVRMPFFEQALGIDGVELKMHGACLIELPHSYCTEDVLSSNSSGNHKVFGQSLSQRLLLQSDGSHLISEDLENLDEKIAEIFGSFLQSEIVLENV
ncbi:MAG: hypothetical protein ABW168_11655 [Sedimenticola sp.]